MKCHHSGIDLLPQLLFFQKRFRCLGLHQDRIFNAIVTVQRVMRFIAIHPPVISSFCTLRVSDRLQHIFCYFYKVIGFINIGIQIPEIDFLHYVPPFRFTGPVTSEPKWGGERHRHNSGQFHKKQQAKTPVSQSGKLASH